MKKRFLLLSFLTIVSYAHASFPLELGGAGESSGPDLHELFARKFHSNYIIPDRQESLYLRVRDVSQGIEAPREKIMILDFSIDSNKKNFPGVYPQISRYNSGSDLLDYFWDQIHDRLKISRVRGPNTCKLSFFSSMNTLLSPKEFSNYLDLRNEGEGEGESNREVYFKLLEDTLASTQDLNRAILDRLMDVNVPLGPVIFGLPRETGTLCLKLSSITAPDPVSVSYQEMPNNKRAKQSAKTKLATVQTNDIQTIEITDADADTIKEILSEMFSNRIEELFKIFNPENHDNSVGYN